MMIRKDPTGNTRSQNMLISLISSEDLRKMKIVRNRREIRKSMLDLKIQ